MLQHLQSKTVVGLLVLLIFAVALDYFGKLTPAMEDFLKWIGTAYMGVRAVANAVPGSPNQ